MPEPAATAQTPVNPVFRYTRRQALEDTLLVDLSVDAAEAGFTIPVAVTKAVFERCIQWTEQDTRKKPRCCQDQDGRQWDVLWMASLRCQERPKEFETLYQLRIVPRPGHGRKRLQTLKLKVTRGDAGEIVATILLPDES